MSKEHSLQRFLEYSLCLHSPATRFTEVDFTVTFRETRRGSCSQTVHRRKRSHFASLDWVTLSTPPRPAGLWLVFIHIMVIVSMRLLWCDGAENLRTTANAHILGRLSSRKQRIIHLFQSSSFILPVCQTRTANTLDPGFYLCGQILHTVTKPCFIIVISMLKMCLVYQPRKSKQIPKVKGRPNLRMPDNSAVER